MKKLTEKLEGSFERWNHLKEYGGSDPFWEDGCNMNLVRNHISYYKNQIKELSEREGLGLPEIYYKETPQEVNPNYMANANKIREEAEKALRAYENDKNFRELEEIYPDIKDEGRRQLADSILRNKKTLKHSIETNNLVSMRRDLNYERYLKSAKSFIESASEEDYVGQLSLF